jgi:thioredoxin-like negative regulator of GroEL
MEKGHNVIAARDLEALLTWRPDSDEARYLLGTCEMARGRILEADRAFAGVPPDSHFAPQAILGRLQLQLEQGRLSAAEEIVQEALNDPRVNRSGLPLLLGPVYSQQGRLEETLRLLEVSWEALNQEGKGSSEQAINLIRAHHDLRTTPVPVEVIRTALDQAASLDPKDDRVWLGKANLAIRIGSYDEASKWLDACEKKRPNDIPVWRARLTWALATNNTTEARKALKHLPAEEWTPAQIQKLAVWFAAQRGDVGSERRALESLLATDPADLDALDQLAELAAKDGQPQRPEELVRKKAEITRLQARYEKLFRRNQPVRDAEEMARLAKQLGLGFEARAFLTMVVAENSRRNDLRRELAEDERSAREARKPGRTLADVLAPEIGTGVGA